MSNDFKDVLWNTNPHVMFTKKENNLGQQYLKDFGIKPDEKFICFIVRDPAYKEIYQANIKPDWSYHDFRNSNIQNCKKAISTLSEKGYWIFRMGKGVASKFNTNQKRVFDYANSDFRSDFLDIWLFANCHFCVAGNPGIFMLTQVYRKPTCQINITQLHLQGWLDNRLMIFKKFFLINFLSLLH